jgi:hypothetical protein
MPDWAEREREVARVAGCQLFFVGGAPRSGTTWLQRLLDAHPEVSCGGEGLFDKELAQPLERLLDGRRQALAAKNAVLFGEAAGYPLPSPGDGEFLLRTAILLALRRQAAGKPCRALGEKTPENLFFFPRLQHLFPAAKFVGIARDPRDVLASAWHFFRHPAPGKDAVEEKTAFIRSALPSLAAGARAMVAMQQRSDCRLVTYEALSAAPVEVMAGLFRFLGVSDADPLVDACVERTSFAALSGGRAAGTAADGSFFRKGVVGDWPTTLTAEMNALVMAELGWTFPHFGWPA